MIVRLIAETLTPIVAKSRFLRIHGAQGVISNRHYFDLKAPTRHQCRTTLIVKQGAHGFPIYRRAYMGYLHLDFKTKTFKQANRKIRTFLQLCGVGQLTAWGYGEIRWIFQKIYHNQESSRLVGPLFRILKGLPPNLTAHETQLVMAALLHDLVDTELHPSKLGRPVTIQYPYVRQLCEHHHSLKEHPHNPDLQLLQEADIRTSRYGRLLSHPTGRRKLAPVDTNQLAHQLEQATQCSVYKLYTVIYHSQELNRLTASKTHPTETLRYHLLGVANWVLFLLRTRASTLLAASPALAGHPGGTPGPVEMEDPQTTDVP
ncbi:MAG: hypothetical protein ACE5I5_00010 [Candidatus Heimdallarchaeota archaeon]